MGNVTKPILLDETGQAMVAVLQAMNGTLGAGLLKSAPEITDFHQIQTYVRLGVAEQIFPVGTQFIVFKKNNKADTVLKYHVDVVAHNHHFLSKNGANTAEYSMTIQFHELFETNMMFDQTELAYALTADTALADWKTYYTRSGAEGSYTYTAVASPAAADIASYYEKNNADRAQYGSNNWRESAMRQWLNSDKAAGEWWAAQTIWDVKPDYADNTAGFLTLLRDAVDAEGCTWLDILKPVTIQTVLNTVKNPDNSSYYLDADADGVRSSARKAYDITEDVVFLPSAAEVFENQPNDGTVMPYYRDFSDFSNPTSWDSGKDSNRIKYPASGGAAGRWRLRSPHTAISRLVRPVSPTGHVLSSTANHSGVGLAPLAVIY